MKEDKFADVRGKEIDFIEVRCTPPRRIEAFVAGVDDNAISIHPLDKEEAIAVYAELFKESIEQQTKAFEHPHDYLLCIKKSMINGEMRYNKLLQKLKQGCKEIKAGELEGIDKPQKYGTFTSCPF